MFYTFLYLDSNAIRIPIYYQNTHILFAFYLPHTAVPYVIIPSTSTLYYQKSYFTRTIIEWNNLLVDTIESDSLDKFCTSLTYI